MSSAVMSLSIHHSHVHGRVATSAGNRLKKKLSGAPCWSSRGPSSTALSQQLPCLRSACRRRVRRPSGPIYHAVRNQNRSLTRSDGGGGGDDDDGREGAMSDKVNNQFFRENLERILGNDDLNFTGTDLATLIRKKYGRSYDVQLIKKEFMGRNLLAMNVMWKYVEQRSFPLTEEEYLLRLDDVANTLKCWGAVSHVRNSLARLKERPRIGKAVSIFIDMDESGGRSNEWIYK